MSFTLNQSLQQQVWNDIIYYLKKNVFDAKNFYCCHKNGCQISCTKSANRHFFEGLAHHIGPFYALEQRGQSDLSNIEFRVMVTGQEYGGNVPYTPYPMETRQADIISAGTKYTFSERNPHMRGTTSVLRLIFGLELGPLQSDEYIDVDGRKTHIFEAFALANYLLCSCVEGKANGTASMRGQATTIMLNNCNMHYRQLLEISRPNILVIQSTTFFWAIKKAFHNQLTQVTSTYFIGNLNGQKVHIAAFTHPAAYYPKNYGNSFQTPYLLNTIVPTIDKIRHALGLPPSPGVNSP